MIVEYIENSVNDKQLRLDEIILRIDQHFGDNVLTNAEKNFVREEYTTNVIEKFLRHLQEDIESLDVNSIKKWKRSSRRINKKLMITFQDIEGIQLIEHCWSDKIFSKKNETNLLSQLSTICELHLSKFITSLQHDCQKFLQKFEDFLKEEYDKNWKKLMMLRLTDED